MGGDRIIYTVICFSREEKMVEVSLSCSDEGKDSGRHAFEREVVLQEEFREIVQLIFYER